MSENEPRGIDINWPQTLGGALAAMSSAVLLSTFGVAGTIIGAAVGSIVLTLGGAVYSHYLQISRERVARAARAAALARAAHLRIAASRSSPGDTRVDTEARAEQAEQAAEAEERSLAEAGRSVDWREALRGLPWKRIAVASVGIFVLAMGAIVAFELAAGRPVSSYTGGSGPDGPRTSIPGLGGSAATGRQQDQDEDLDEDQNGPAPDGQPPGPAHIPSDRGGTEYAPIRPPSGRNPSVVPTQPERQPGAEPTGEPSAQPTTAEPSEPAPTPTPTPEPTSEPTTAPSTTTAPTTAPSSSPSG